MLKKGIENIREMVSNKHWVESTIDECNTAPVVNKYLRQYAEMIQKYADAVAENVRLREAMNKYSEDEMLLIERCAKVCEVMGFKHSECPEMSEYCADAIRALKVEK